MVLKPLKPILVFLGVVLVVLGAVLVVLVVVLVVWGSLNMGKPYGGPV